MMMQRFEDQIEITTTQIIEDLRAGKGTGDFVLDVAAREVTLDHGGVVSLSGREADVLIHLARNPRRVFARDELLHAAFDDAEDEGLVDTYVHYLRRKLGRESVLTVRGVGYRLGRP